MKTYCVNFGAMKSYCHCYYTQKFDRSVHICQNLIVLSEYTLTRNLFEVVLMWAKGTIVLEPI
jgi:hypothetical protein